MSVTQHDIWVESGVYVEKDDTDMTPADRARHMAAEAFYEPDYGRPKSVGLNRARFLTLADAPGNTLDDFAKWWGNRSMFGQALYVCLAVGACCFTAGLLVGYAR